MKIEAVNSRSSILDVAVEASVPIKGRSVQVATDGDVCKHLVGLPVDLAELVADDPSDEQLYQNLEGLREFLPRQVRQRPHA